MRLPSAQRITHDRTMMRLGAIFVAVCMLIIAASAGVISYYYLAVSVSEAATIAIAALTALALYNIISTRLGLQNAVGRQLAELSHGVGDLARQVAEIGRRLAAAEGRAEAAVERARAVTDPLMLELGELGTLIKHLAETLDGQQAKLEALERPLAPAAAAAAAAPMAVAFRVAPPELAPAFSAPPPVVPAAPPAPAASTAPAAPTAGAPAVPTGMPAGEPAAQLFAAGPPAPPPAPEAERVAPAAVAAAPAAGAPLAAIQAAIDANRIDLYLQPIVTLPQRKVRYYEAISRLRSELGEVMHAASFIPQAEAGGLMPKIDNLVVFRCVQIVRRLLLKNREVGLFCNLSAATLTNATIFRQVLEFLDANRAIAPSLVLEFTQSALRAMGPIEHESLAALRERGLRLSVDNVTDLRIEPRELANRGFRFIKVPASLLLDRSGAAAATDIHPADLSDLLARFGIDLIAEKIENEGIVVDLLDDDVRYGQGFLFSPPRPVRAEALQGIADRNDVVAHDIATGAGGGPPTSAPAPGPATARAERMVGLAHLARSSISRAG